MQPLPAAPAAPSRWIDRHEALHLLLEPFHPSEVRWLPRNKFTGSYKGRSGVAMAWGVPYLQKPALIHRLNTVFPLCWSFEFQPMDAAGFQVKGRLMIRLEDGPVYYEDAGESGEDQSKEKLKSATTDAFKRCCEMAGIGLYLDALPYPRSYCGPYDEKKNQWVELPVIPEAEMQVALASVGMRPGPAPGLSLGTPAPLTAEKRAEVVALCGKLKDAGVLSKEVWADQFRARFDAMATEAEAETLMLDLAVFLARTPHA
jgi:hypothetical protein